MEEQTTTRTPGPSLPPAIRYAGSAVILWVLIAWLVNWLACYHRLWGFCGPSTYVTLTIGAALLVLAPLAWTYRERALRRASKGMWARSGWGLGSNDLAVIFKRTARFAIEGEWPDSQLAGVISGTQRFERRGWWVTVPIAGGTEVWVDRWALWQWLIKVEALRGQLPPGESEIGQRYWEPRIGRPLWMAYMIILEAVGAAETVTPDPRSRRYVGGDAWGWVEAYEAIRASEAR
jgi:hypothetical protein